MRTPPDAQIQRVSQTRARQTIHDNLVHYFCTKISLKQAFYVYNHIYSQLSIVC